HQVLTMRRRDSLPEVAPSAFLSADREGPAPAEEGSALHPLYPALPDPDELLAGTDLHEEVHVDVASPAGEPGFGLRQCRQIVDHFGSASRWPCSLADIGPRSGPACKRLPICPSRRQS